jgi:hypothetical protein
MSKAAKDYNYPLRLPAADAKALNEVCRQNRTSFNRVVALCVRKALPAVREALAAESGRITNVDPLPDKTLKRLYAETDDDSRQIARMMAAQCKVVEE